MIKAIMFDLDNTLIDFAKIKKLSCESAIDAMIDNGLKISKKKALKIMFDSYDKYGWEHQRIFQVFMKKVMKKIDYRIMCSGIAAYRKIKETLLCAYPNVSSILDKLRKDGYKLVILTDAPRIQAWIRLAAMEIQNKFDYVITFDDTRKKKTNEKPFLFVLKKLKLKPEEIIMIGDSIRRDLKIPKKLGIITILAKYGQLEKENGKVDYEINDISDILDIIKKL